MGRSETRYARSGEISIAFQVVGEGPFDLVYVPGWVSNIELMWEEPELARFLERMASGGPGGSGTLAPSRRIWG